MNRSRNIEWVDPAALAAAGRKMAGIDFLRAIRDGDLPAPPIGVVHGGLAMTLLDSAMGCSVQTRTPPGGGYTTLEAKTNLVRAITDKTGRLRAIGKVLHFGSRIATAEGRLEDASGKLYAHATSTCIVLNAG